MPRLSLGVVEFEGQCGAEGAREVLEQDATAPAVSQLRAASADSLALPKEPLGSDQESTKAEGRGRGNTNNRNR